jgi:hypothetical protein
MEAFMRSLEVKDKTYCIFVPIQLIFFDKMEIVKFYVWGIFLFLRYIPRAPVTDGKRQRVLG